MFTCVSDRRQSSCSHTSTTEGSQVHTHQWQKAVKLTHISDRKQLCSHISATGGSHVHIRQWQEAVKFTHVSDRRQSSAPQLQNTAWLNGFHGWGVLKSWTLTWSNCIMKFDDPDCWGFLVCFFKHQLNSKTLLPPPPPLFILTIYMKPTKGAVK